MMSQPYTSRPTLRRFGLREPENDPSVLVRQDHRRCTALPSLKVEIKARHPYGLLRIVRLQSKRGNRRDATLDRDPIKHRATFAFPANGGIILQPTGTAT